jgi:dTDP-4-dehydrorhamnose reductase
MLGQDLAPQLEGRHELLPVDLPEVDITDPDAMVRCVDAGKPDVVIHAAAFTAVDDCERQPERAFLVNSVGTRNVGLACRRAGIPMLYISTDYVFDGEKDAPYLENDRTNPLNIYGESKLEGECHVRELVPHFWIVRTSWLFGPRGKNFVQTILGRVRAGEALRVVDDQVGAPTYTVDLAAKLLEIVERGKTGIYHVTNQGYCSWFEFSREIARQAGFARAEISPVPTLASDRPARRPLNSRLENSRLESEGLGLLPAWTDALGCYLGREARAEKRA